MGIRPVWRAVVSSCFRFSRWTVPRGRKVIAAGTAVAVAIGLTVAAVAITASRNPGLPVQQQWGTPAASSHRAPASATMQRVVNGRAVPAPGRRKFGPVSLPASIRPKGAIPPATRARAPKPPAKSRVTQAVRVLPAPAAQHKTGYVPKTSRVIPAGTKADQVVYANADGTRTAFEFQSPVNYQQPDGQWAAINTTLAPAGGGPAATPSPSSTPTPLTSPAKASLSAAILASPSSAAATTPSAPVASGMPSPVASSPTPAGSSATPPSPSPTTGLPSPPSVPTGGWREKAAAEPLVFAGYADAERLVSMPLGGSRSVSFGVAGSAHAAGVAAGSTVTYPGVLAGSDLRFSAGTGMVKEQLILHSAAAPTTWLFPLTLTGLHAVMGPGGTVEFADAAGKALAYVPHGFMTDSNVNPHSGNGVTSTGVSYSLTTVAGRPAIRMTLDGAWLHSKARVFPVTVDPSLATENSNGTTFVQSPFTADNSSSPEIDVGTYDGGSNITKSFLKFDNVSSALKNDTVLGVELGLFNTWSFSCSPRAVYVYPVTSSWSVTGSKSWPGPSTGSPIGRKTFASGWTPSGSTTSPCPDQWEGINLDQGGTSLVNGWSHGTVSNNGLALGASSSDSYAWKKFTSDNNPGGDPYLSILYSPYGASYKLASSKPVQQVWPNQNGKIAIRVTNTGSATWTPSNGYELSYRAYNSSGTLVANHPVFTPMPSNVAPGQSVTVNATVNALAVGSYAIDFDMFANATSSSPVSFSSQGTAPFAIGLSIPQPPPVVSNVYPPNGYVAPTVTPQLSTTASSSTGGTITYDFTLTCQPLPGEVCPATAIDSGQLSTPYWTPQNAMVWNTPYSWTVTATVNGSSTTVGPVSITPEVPQPTITSGLGASSGQAFDPQSGNYTTSATDAAVASPGPPLAIGRTYNSLDPRTSGAFGAGWSSALDAAVTPDSDGSGSVVVTLPGGQQMRFGSNGGSVYAPPMGSQDALAHNSDGTWSLTDASANRYSFTSGGQISAITDPNGLTQTFTRNAAGQVTTITSTASGRALHLSWSTPSGAAYPHVSSVSTDSPSSGQSGYSWTYSYNADELSSACSPTGGCTSYSSATGSHYQTAVLDSGPRSYWQLGEASGSSASDEVDANLGTTDGTYSNVTLGAAGPLAGSSETAASFDGTSSSVSLPPNLITDGTDVTIELWFKAASSTSSGVLFSYAADQLSNSSGNSADHDPAIYVGGNGRLYGELWNGKIDPLSSSASVDNGSWHHVVLTGNSSTQSLYLDGALVGTLSGQIDQQNMTQDTVGAGFWGSWPSAYQQQGPSQVATPIGYFDGSIGQVAVYPRALGQSAITAHYGLAAVASPELTQVTMPSGRVYEQVSYDAPTGRVDTYTDSNGGQWTIHQPIATGYKATPDSLGEVTRYVTVADPAARDEVYGYDALNGGRLVSYNNGADPPRTFGYDSAGFLDAVADEDGNLASFTNDLHGNVLSRTWYPTQPGSVSASMAAGPQAAAPASSSSCTTTGAACTTYYSYYYNAANPLDPRNDELTGVRDARSASSTDNTYLTSYAYNTAGQLTSVTTPATSDFPNGRTTSYAYSTGSESATGGGNVPVGLLLSETTPGNAVTSYQYYSDGDLAQVTEPGGRRTAYTYDGVGRPATSTVYTDTYPSGLGTTYAYNAMGQPVTVTYPGVTDKVTTVTHTLQDSYSYDADGNLTQLAQSDLTGSDPSRTTSYTYDDHGHVATETDPAGATTAYDYDPFGNVVTMTDADGNVHSYTYNEYNEVTQVALHTNSTDASNPAAGTDQVLDSYTYDPAGLLAASTDAMGRITNYGYDHNQDLVSVTTTDASTSPTTGRQTTYTYDGAGNLASQAVNAMSGGGITTSTVTNYTVDAAGRRASQMVDPTPSGTSASGYVNRSTSYTYNADNHVTSQTVSDGLGSSTTNDGYNTAGNLTSQSVQNGSTSQTTTWTYDQNGLPLSMTTPRGNTSGATAGDYTTNYAYDQGGNPSTVTGPPVATQSYAAQSPATTRAVTTYGYDTFGDRTGTKDPIGNVTVTGYDGAGRVTSVAQPSYTPPGGSTAINATTSYSYDGLGNLTQLTDPAQNVTKYAYDALGDLVSQTDPQLPGQSAPGVWSYTYDAAASSSGQRSGRCDDARYL